MQKKINKLITDLIAKNLSSHIPGSALFDQLNKYFKFFYKDHRLKKKSNLYLGCVGKFKLPFFKMGKINSSHLLGLNEIILFIFYSLYQKSSYKNVADLGANIGMHSIILSKLGFRVRAFEPDPDHINQFLKNLKINKLRNCKLIEKAVDTKKNMVTFTKILNNTTGSFIKSAKKNTYGPTKKFEVETEKFSKIFKWADIIKMDVEGMEAELITSTNKVNWGKKIIILEIGNIYSRKKIFNFCKIKKLNIYSQKIAWSKAHSVYDIPKSHMEGSVIITKLKSNPWIKI